jgi:hypothetical protein
VGVSEFAEPGGNPWVFQVTRIVDATTSSDPTPAANPPARPQALRVIPENIPAELTARPRWVLWRYDFRNGKWTKPPYTPAGTPADSTGPSTWSSFGDALEAYEVGGWDGIGFIHMPEDSLTGGDADHSRDPRTGIVSGDDAALILQLDTCTEASPSATGIRAYAIGWKPGRRCKRGGFERYDGLTAGGKPGGRYLTVTGHRIDGTPSTINERQEAITRVYNTVFGGRASGPERYASTGSPSPLTDAEILDRLRRARNRDRFERLYRGDTAGYPSASEADAAMAAMIGFYTRDSAQILRVIRGSKFYRDKWDRGDYAERTIGGALALVTEHYSPGRSATGRRVGNAEASGKAFGPDGPKLSESVESDTPREGWQIIRDYFAARHRPAFKAGDAIYSNVERREIKRSEACSALPPDLIQPLSHAANAPQFKGGGANSEALPGFFRKWAGTAWDALVRSLPDEDAAALDVLGDAREEFRRMVRDALLSEFTLARTTIDPRTGARETKIELRSAVGWCVLFAKPGPWRSVRSKQLWCRLVDHAGGELELRVAFRHGLLAQLKADRKLTAMTPNKFTRRAKRYGVGHPGGQEDRPHGQWALVLDRQFLEDLTSTVSDDICTPLESATDPAEGVQETGG